MKNWVNFDIKSFLKDMKDKERINRHKFLWKMDISDTQLNSWRKFNRIPQETYDKIEETYKGQINLKLKRYVYEENQQKSYQSKN